MWTAEPSDVDLTSPFGHDAVGPEAPVDDMEGMSLWSDSLDDNAQDVDAPAPQQVFSFLQEGLNTTPTDSQKAPELTIATYFPSSNVSPLSNPQTAAVFWHFVNVTAPMISLYESNGMYNGRFALIKPVPVSIPYAGPETSVWTGKLSDLYVIAGLVGSPNKIHRVLSLHGFPTYRAPSLNPCLGLAPHCKAPRATTYCRPEAP